MEFSMPNRPRDASRRPARRAGRFALLSAVAFLPLLAGAEAAAQSASVLDEVVVTGSRLSGGHRIAPVEVIDRQRLAAAGVSDASEVLRLVTANSGSEARVDQLNQPQSSGTAQFNLRNLGLGSTLVLVDNRRWTSSAVVATDGSAFVDINSLIPMIAVQRVEAVKDGASALYGSDAVGGVVNFITRGNVARPELMVSHAVAAGSDETSVEALAGLDAGGGRLILAASRFHRSALGSDERAFTQAERYGRAPWTAVTSYGQPGSYFRPGRGTFAPDPDCDNPAFESAYRDNPADAFCRLDYSDFFDLAPEETRTQVFADFRRPVGSSEIWLQGAWASTKTLARQSPSLPILARSLSVPAAHPDNPFGETVLFRGRLLGAEAGASTAEFDYRTWRLAGGVSGDLGQDWTWDLAATASRQHVAYDKPDVIGSALQNALNGLGGTGCDPATGRPGSGACHFFNPFGSAWLGTGTANSPALVDSLIGSTGLRGAASLITIDANLSGAVLATEAMSIDLAIGGQYRRSSLRHDWSDLVNAGDLLTAGFSPDFAGASEIFAAYAEARLRLGSTVEVQLAARHEGDSDRAGRFSPKIAARWAVTEAVSLRGSWGEGFRAPSVFTRSGAQAAQPSVFDRGAFVFVNTLASGDPDLRPETSENLALGGLWRPTSQLEFSLDAWRIDYADLVVKESAQAVIDKAAADDAAGLTGTDAQRRVTRSASGALSFVQLYFTNASSVRTQGLDVSGRYETPLAGGLASVSATWPYVDRYDIRLAAGAPSVSGAGSTNLNTIARSLPRNRGEMALSWSGPSQGLTALIHYTSSYRNDRSGITQARIASQMTADLLYRRAVREDLTVSIGALNLFDKAPPLAQFALGYDPVVADPRGRIWSLSLSKTF